MIRFPNMYHPALLSCPCGCSERGSRAPTPADRVEAYAPSDHDDGRSPYLALALAPPWRDFKGYTWDGASMTSHAVYGEPYGPVSPRTGRPTSYGRAFAEWEASSAGGGLWDEETAQAYARANAELRAMLVERRKQRAKVRVRGLLGMAVMLRAVRVQMVRGRLVRR